MLSRRQVLVGMGALAAFGFGVVAVEESDDPRVRRALHRFGLVHSPDAHVPDAHTEEISGELTSASMPRAVGWSISVPSMPVQGVIYCLHSRGGDHRMAFDAIRIPDVVAAAKAPLAVAAIDGGSASYWHRRANGMDPLAMLLDEFIPMVEARLGVAPRRALMGWSMGGYGALLAAERAPDRFDVVTAASAALWTTPSAVAEGAFDGEADYRRHNVYADIDSLADVTVRVDCGTDDPFLEADREFAARLPRRNHGRFSAGFHDAAYWRSIAGDQVATIAEAIQNASP